MFVVQSKYATKYGLYWVYWGKFNKRIELRQYGIYTEMLPKAEWYYANGWDRRYVARKTESKVPDKMIVDGHKGTLIQKQVIDLW